MSTDIERTDHALPEYLSALDEKVRFADLVSQAGIIPDAFRGKPADILIAEVVADQVNADPFTVMQEMGVISGKPSFSAKFMRSLVRRAGHRLRESFDPSTGTARCVIIRADDPDFENVVEWDEAKARKHGYWGKGHWAKNPQLMLSNRALTECVRMACYEVMGGIGYTPDEIEDAIQTRVEQRHDQPQAASREAKPPVDTAKAPVKTEWRRFNTAAKSAEVTPEQMLDMARTVLGRDIDVAGFRALGQEDVDRLTGALEKAATEKKAEKSDVVDAEVVDETTGEVAQPTNPWAEGDAMSKEPAATRDDLSSEGN